jgi:asparagine synthase (glutamine-hydrolysing)
VNNELKEPVFDYLTSTECFYKNFVEQKFVLNLLNGKIKIPAEKRAKILWTLLSLEIWYKKVYKYG